MTLKGLDISNHQGSAGFRLSQIAEKFDFVYVKATGGSGFVDKYCDAFVREAKKLGKLWGFYHFGDDGYGWNASAEADWFISNCENYFGEGIPILDWERDSMTVAGVNEFVRIVHDRTGVWPLIYANPWRFNKGGVEPNCGRIIAHYPDLLRPTLTCDLPDVPATDGLVAMWQYCSDGVVRGAEKFDLDLDRFYGDNAAWDAYARGDRENVASSPTTSGGASVLENDYYRVTIERK